jgi:ribonuclease-3
VSNARSVADVDARVAAALGHAFATPARLETALTHPSFAAEHPDTESNERLEFLGDAVLDLVVPRLLFERQPDWREGQLTRARAALVNTRALSKQARALGLGQAARLGRTEQGDGESGTEKDSILANLFEAVIGALYLDGGLAPVVALVKRLFADAFASGEAVLARDPKTHFQEWAHARLGVTPHYRAIADSGVEEAEDRFTVEVRIGDEVWGSGVGRTKRAAERAAAARGLEHAGTQETPDA